MKRILSLLLLIGLLSFQTPAKDSPVPDEKNPIYNEFNETIDFAAINAEHIKSATASIQEKVKTEIDKVVSIPDEERNYENSLLAVDDIQAMFADVYTTIYLLSSTHSDSLIRNTALESRVTLAKFDNEIELSEDLYKSVKAYSNTEEAKSLEGYKAKERGVGICLVDILDHLVDNIARGIKVLGQGNPFPVFKPFHFQVLRQVGFFPVVTGSR